MVSATAVWAATDNIHDHRRCHACVAERRKSSGASRALTAARLRRTSVASGAHLPPTSHPSTTSRARSPPTSSAYRTSCSRRARSIATPFRSAAPDQADPSAWSGDAMDASPQMGTPWYKGNPRATRSTRLSSPTGSPRSNSRSSACGTTRAPPSRKTRCHARSSGLALRWTLPVRMQLAKWSPIGSSVRRHAWPGHRRQPSGRGKRRRRRSAVWKTSGRIAVSRAVGSASSQWPAPGPEADRSIARCGGGRDGRKACSRKWVSVAVQA